MSDTPTPRTHAAVDAIQKQGVDWHYSGVKMAEFARQLERELAAEREAREKAEKQFGTCSECGFVAWKNRDKTTEECQFCLMRQRAEQAEARLNIALKALDDMVRLYESKWSDEPDALKRAREAIDKIKCDQEK